MTIHTARKQLAPLVMKHKKAWLIAAAISGYKANWRQRNIPDYTEMKRRELESCLNELRQDIATFLDRFIGRNLAIQSKSVTWLSEQYDRWGKAGFGVFVICNLHQFELQVAPLRVHEHMDIPPYAELMIQPGLEVAFRHPEYMLARDLDLLYSLFMGAETLLKGVNWSHPVKWAASASENSQALARASIQACFNLIESFTSGLSHAYVMTNPTMDEKTRKKILDTRIPLRTRILAVPRLITGVEIALDYNKYPLGDLFGKIKKQRDSFVHCEPGVDESERGYVKEAMFHDVIGPERVNETIRATTDVIRCIWKAVHGRQGPKWLPDIGTGRNSERLNLVIAPPVDSSAIDSAALDPAFGPNAS
jgi:hypothetical protein